MQLMERAIVRSGLELRHTEGFNPHPKIATSPALSLGIASRAEYLLFYHWGPVPEEALAKLNQGLMEGLEVHSIVPRGEIEKSRFLQPRQAVYSVVLPPGLSEEQGESPEGLAGRVSSLVRHFDGEHPEGGNGCLLAEHRGLSELQVGEGDSHLLQFAMEFHPANGPAPKLRDFLGKALELSEDAVSCLLITRLEIRL